MSSVTLLEKLLTKSLGNLLFHYNYLTGLSVVEDFTTSLDISSLETAGSFSSTSDFPETSGNAPLSNPRSTDGSNFFLHSKSS